MMNNRSKTKIIFTTSGSMSRPLNGSILSVKVVLGAALTVVVFTVLVKLGFWQMSRGQEKQALEQRMAILAQREPISMGAALRDYPVNVMTGLRVSVSVNPSHNMTFVLDNQTYSGMVGYLAYQLARESNGYWILVERGFVPASTERNVLPEVNWLESQQTLSGRLYQKSSNPLSHELNLEAGTPHRIQNLNIEALSQWLGEDILPVAFQPQEDNWPYPQPWVPLPLSSEKHFAYAVQWFSMATVLLVIAVMIIVRMLKSGRQQ